MKNKNEMNQYKHICELEYCKKHSQCIYRNATSSLKSDSYIVVVGNEKNSDRILCFEKPSPVVIEVSYVKSNESHCQNPKCNSIADLKWYDKINLCYKCLDLLRWHRSNHELAKYFNSKEKILKLLSVIEKLENEKRKESDKVYEHILWNNREHNSASSRSEITQGREESSSYSSLRRLPQESSQIENKYAVG